MHKNRSNNVSYMFIIRKLNMLPNRFQLIFTIDFYSLFHINNALRNLKLGFSYRLQQYPQWKLKCNFMNLWIL